MSNLLKEAIVDAKALREAALKNAEASVIDKYSDEVRATLNKLLEQEDTDLGLDDPLGGDELGLPPAPDAAGAPVGEKDESLEEDVEDVPYAATDNVDTMDGKNLKNIPGEGTPVELTLDLGALRESVEKLQSEIDEELNLDEYTLIDMLKEDAAEEEEEGVNAAEMSGDDDAAVGDAAGEEADAAASSGPKGSTIAEDEEIELSDGMIDEIVERLTVDMGATLKGWAGRSSEDIKWELTKALAQRRSTDVQD